MEGETGGLGAIGTGISDVWVGIEDTGGGGSTGEG